jgi:hypothetical protein
MTLIYEFSIKLITASTYHGPHAFNIQNGVHGLQFSGMQKSTFFCICAYITTETQCGYMDIGNSERRKLIFFLAYNHGW